jgi:hypothetical protein
MILKLRTERTSFYSLALLASLMMGGVLLAACQPAAAQPSSAQLTDTAAALPATPAEPTVTATLTPLPATATPTGTPTQTGTPTETPTPAPDFSSLRFIGVTASANGVSIIIEIPNLKQVYDLNINGVDYICQQVEEVVDRLFCNGLAKPPFDRSVRVLLREPETKTILYDTFTSIAGSLLTTPAPRGYYDPNCPQRGLDVKCEMECRIPPEGSPCVVASCYDSCGLYFSVHTCPENVDYYPNQCSAEQWAEMKARHSIP